MTSIDDLLAEAASAIDRCTASVTPNRPVGSAPRRSLAVVAVVLVLGLSAGLATLALSRLGGESDEVAIATEADGGADGSVPGADAGHDRRPPDPQGLLT